MILEQTVFVLGAGASWPYGFPSGPELVDTIETAIRHKEDAFYKRLQDVGFEAGRIEEFGRALAGSRKWSVDAFLEGRPDFLDLGKAAIACALVPRENPGNFDNVRPASGETDDWYRYVFNKLAERRNRWAENNLSVITFNYDRSFEYYMLTALQHAFGLSGVEAWKAVERIPIVHVHGQLGRLAPDGVPDVRPFNTQLTESAIRMCTQSIRVIPEDVVDATGDVEFSRAHELLTRAETVCFLGFGYHALNLERLKARELCRGKRAIYGSAYGILAAERAPVVAAFAASPPITLGETNWGVLRFLREQVILA